MKYIKQNGIFIRPFHEGIDVAIVSTSGAVLLQAMPWTEYPYIPSVWT
jgi:hypothetical protein